MMRSRSSLVISLALAALVLVSTGLARAQNYTVTDLGILPGKKSTSAYGLQCVNAAGEVTGHCNNGDLTTGLFGDFFSENVAFHWTKREGIQALPMPPGAPNASGWAINDRGQIIGLAGSSYFDGRLVLWEKGAVRVFEPLPGDSFTGPEAINNRGQIVGVSGVPSQEGGFAQSLRPVLWENGEARLMPMAGFPHGQANGLNERGQVVGILGDTQLFNWQPVLWDRGVTTVLGSLGGGFGFAWGINNKGRVVGQSQAADGSVHGFSWEDGVMTDLGSLGGSWCSLWALNQKGAAVGESSDANEEIRAIRVEDGVMRDLNDLIPADSGWFLATAGGINDRGQIAGIGIRNGEVRSFLLTPSR
jgi:probable HAF family extracellular repeat protein